MKHWDEAGIREFGRQVADLIAGYFAGLETIPITPQGGGDLEALFGGPMPEEGADPFALLEEIRTNVLPNSFHLPAPRYFGLFNPTPTVIGVFADAIASTINQNMAAWCHGPAGSQIEKTVIRWLCDLVGLGPGAFGTLTNGGTLANYTGLKVGLDERIPAIRKEGVAAAGGRPAFYVSDQAHYSLERLANMLGIGLEGMRRVTSDAEGRVDAAEIDRRIRADREGGWWPFAVVGIAGTTTSGAVDPLDHLAQIARQHRLWYHIDAAWGAAALLSREHRSLFKGIEEADSVAVDPHKWFSVPFTAGGILARDGASLRRTFEVKPLYASDRGFTDHEDLNLYQYGVAGSRRLDALKVWLSLRQYGRRGYGEAIRRQIGMAEYLARRVASSDHLEAVTRPSLGILCFRCVPPALRGRDGELDALQMKIQQAVERRGRAWISTSVLRGRRVIRFCATSYLTRERHVDLMLEEVLAAAR